MRTLAAIYHSLLQILAPAEGEEWLVGLAVALLLLGSARHRLEPWLAGIAADPPVGAEAVVEAKGVAADSTLALPPAVLAAITPIEPASFGRVDVNRATAEELETLPRIGPALAQRIIADREAHGPFATIEDLDRVKGIGPATLAALAGDVVIGPSAGAPAGPPPLGAATGVPLDSPAGAPLGDSTRALQRPPEQRPPARPRAE